MRGTKLYAMFAAMFIAGAFLASPELRAYAANTIFSTDIKDGEVKTPDLANNAVTAAKIKDDEVKAAEIAIDSVGAAEIAGVTKLLFGKCVVSSTDGTTDVPSGSILIINCAISGVDSNDRAIASLTEGHPCFDLRTSSTAQNNQVRIRFVNDCAFITEIGAGAEISIIVFDK